MSSQRQLIFAIPYTKKVLVTGGHGLNSTEIQDNDDQCKNTFAVMQSLN